MKCVRCDKWWKLVVVVGAVLVVGLFISSLFGFMSGCVTSKKKPIYKFGEPLEATVNLPQEVPIEELYGTAEPEWHKRDLEVGVTHQHPCPWCGDGK